ncbi:RRM domain containing RNA-binding protein [Nitzschia inconspicua]|uniref:RRM domain containing RNA-binding protein n=1 Tax=Nitzschia inconspicua TaxID=303405 RepID=A0A9K3PF75_9STRA|nr:RRM domain containing RNA-binding protein [Nitzschia inconspicua]
MTWRRPCSTTAMMKTMLSVTLLSSPTCLGFLPSNVPSTTRTIPAFKQKRSHVLAPKSINTNSHILLSMVHNNRDADLMEMMVGGERFEMVPLPDSMMETTIFVGNVCEFAQDEDLSNIFQSVSRLRSVPACVVRRANMASMEYAFVTFPSVEEKEAAILRFHGVEFMGRKLRVEEIRDDPRKGRVRVPERMVTYVVGAAKPATKRDRRNSITGGMRRVSRPEGLLNNQSKSNGRSLPSFHTEKRNEKRQQQQLPTASAMFSCLKRPDQEEMIRAMKRGFVSLEGLGYGTGRSKSRLASTHRQWCDELEVPQIVHCKAVHESQLDRVIVDLSPLRITAAVMGYDFDVDEFLVRWKVDIATAAVSSGMEMMETDNLQSSHCERLSAMNDNDCDTADCDPEDVECTMLFENFPAEMTEFVLEVCEDLASPTWQPISRLPVLTMGVFEGDRSSAKAMAKQLANQWETIQELDLFDACSCENEPKFQSKGVGSSSNRAPSQKRNRKRENKKRRRSTRGDLDLMMSYK